MVLMETKMILETTESLAKMIRDVTEQRASVEAAITELERTHNDIIHELEKPSCRYKERSRLATQLAYVRRERRRLKDWLINNQPYFEYIGSDDGKRIRNMLDNLVGRGRKAKRTQEMCNT